MISFIIPTRNEEKAIGKTLKHLRDSFRLVPYEIIVTDDDSNDRTVELAKEFADQVLTHTRQAGDTISANRNRGAAKARYPYLVFLDSDVFIPGPDDFLKKAIDCFEHDPKLVALTVNLRVLPEIATLADRFFFGLVDLIFRIDNNFLGLGGASGKFMMVKTAIFQIVGGFNEKLVVSEDNELFWRLSRVGRTRIEPTLVAYHGGRRVHALGWPRVLFLWLKNFLSAVLFKRSVDKDWKPIR
jgi:glycosyltransferase involved in cell wall biosynthesis